ncbi:MAG TPA: hypothetical protein DD640_04465 [Clostridiales bacterium]|nr:hypothetical protein [Clostridiales bacterium]
MPKARIIRDTQVKPFVLDASYSSKMILDDIVAGAQTIQINEGTLKAGCKTGGGVHEKNEIYFIFRGSAVIHLDQETFNIQAGDTVFIPGGVFHSLDNNSPTEDLVLLTFWENAQDNEVYNLRVKAWGKSFKTIDED